MTVADAIVAALAERGVDTVFGIPGVHNLALFAALEAGGLRTIVVRHEATAAYAADVHGRLTGRPGVCVTTSGPGAANAVAAMGEAQASCSPLLHVTTTVARRHLGAGVSRGVLHEHPRQRDVFAPVSKLAVRAEPRRRRRGRRARVDIAALAPCGPAYVEIPTDVLAEATPGPTGRPAATPPERPLRRHARSCASSPTASSARSGR